MTIIKNEKITYSVTFLSLSLSLPPICWSTFAHCLTFSFPSKPCLLWWNGLRKHSCGKKKTIHILQFFYVFVLYLFEIFHGQIFICLTNSITVPQDLFCFILSHKLLLSDFIFNLKSKTDPVCSFSFNLLPSSFKC